MSPAMAAGITDKLWSLEDIVAKIDAMAPAPKPRGPYKAEPLTLSFVVNVIKGVIHCILAER